MFYDIAADLTALVHLAFIAFVVFGALFGRRSRTWMIVHLACMAYGVLIEIFDWYCPLTYVEQYLRMKAGRGIYHEAFIAHYVNRFIYLDVPQWTLIVVASIVLATNLGLYFHWWRRRPGTINDNVRY